MSFFVKEVLFDGKQLKLTPDNLTQTESNQVTVIIGKNSVGKSRLLSAITKIFQTVDGDNLTIKRERGPFGRPKPQLSEFKLEYEIDGNSVCMAVEKNKVIMPFDFDIHKLPSRVIATSTSPFDKFPVDWKRSNDSNAIKTLYTYLGTKTNAWQYSSVSQLTRVIDSLFSASNKSSSDLDRLRHVFNFLGYEPVFRVEYRMRFNPKNMEKMLSLPKEEALHFLERYSYQGQQIRRVLKEDYQVEQTLDAVKYVLHNFYNSRSPAFEVNLCSGIFSNGSFELYNHTKLLRNIGLMQLSDFALFPLNSDLGTISIRDASSGEQCVILNILGIASEIADNSLICLDEPEISLHPEWQEQFIDLLLKTFTSYKGCHFLIATHSPQIVSKLLYQNCYILTMDDSLLRSSKDYAKRSADYQLANLFRAPGFSNEYINRECVSLLTKISKSGRLEDNDEVRGKSLINLLPLLDDSDAVKQLIYVVKETLEKLAK